jgi:N-acetylneuraminic acid mutarotase
MPTARAEFAAATGPDGRIYALGGVRHGKAGLDQAADFLDVVEAYNPRTNTWTTVAPMHEPRAGLAAVTGTDGRIYAIGGRTQDPTAFSPMALATVEAYTPSTNTWSMVAPMLAPTSNFAAAVGTDGRLYAVGGYVGTAVGALTGNAEAYSPATDTWSVLPPLPTRAIWLAGASGPDGRIYAVGGFSNGYETVNYLKSAEVFAVSVGNWTPIADMSTTRVALAVAAGLDGRIYSIGGGNFYSLESPTSNMSSVEAYTAVTDKWTAAAPMSIGRMGLAAATGPDGRIYALGGWTATPRPGYSGSFDSTAVTLVEAYTPPAGPAVQAPCTFVLGFRALDERIPGIVGDCLENERHDPTTGDGVQHSTNGLLVWRKSDNVVAFTNGYRTWLLGPDGLVARLNTERCPWEANPSGLPMVACGPAP